MRTCFALLCLWLFCQPAAAAPFGSEQHGREIDQLLVTGRQLKRAGQVLAGIGCIAALAATIIGPSGYMADHTELGRAPGTTPAFGPLERTAVGLGAATAAALTVGIALMAEGDARVARAHLLVGAATLQLAVAPAPGGGAVTAALTW